MQDVLNGGSVQIGGSGDAALIDERERRCECLDGAAHAITARAAQLDEIVRRGKGNEKASVVAQDTPEFARIHPCRDGKDGGEGTVGIRHEAIGVGHDPFAAGVAPRGGIYGRN